MVSKWRKAGEEPSLTDIYNDSLFAQILRRDRLRAEEVKALIRQVQKNLKTRFQDQNHTKPTVKNSAICLNLAEAKRTGLAIGLVRPAVVLPLAG